MFFSGNGGIPLELRQMIFEFWKGFIVGVRFKGEDTCHYVVVASSSN
jgi:hypothetical protein